MDVILLLTKPLTLIAVVISSGVSAVCFATLTWWNFVNGVVDFHVGVVWKIVGFIFAFVSLPARIITAFQRERALHMCVRELQAQLENMIWENKELEQQLHRAIKERKVIETVLEEIDEEHEKVLLKIDQFENELQDLTEENLRLKETHGKAPYDYKPSIQKIGDLTYEDPSPAKIYNVPPWTTSSKGTNMIVHENPWTTVQTHKYTPKDEIMEEGILERRRILALSRSLFSSILSLIVGMIIWEAESPCMPLVAALFFVVGMSLNSVLQFYSSMKNKLAFEAVTLLSVNWFVLGTLTYPLLPGFIRISVPWVNGFAGSLGRWAGFYI